MFLKHAKQLRLILTTHYCASKNQCCGARYLCLLLVLVVSAFIPTHCCEATPMKNRNHKVSSRIRIVAVALVSAGTPNSISRVVMVISGKPTSNGMPSGIDFTVPKTAQIISIVPQLICGYLIA